MLNKKAAMFGLDARIALAIFGALSIITGAALYSAIQNAKAIALLTEMQEVGKAWEQYYLDTGQNLPQRSTDDNTASSFYGLQANYLVDKPVLNGWKGPYTSYESLDWHLVHPQYKTVTINIARDDTDWGSLISWHPAGHCVANGRCFVWIHFNGIDNESLAKAIDKKIDNSDGSEKGNLRWWYAADAYKYRYQLKYAITQNPNN